MTEYLISIDAAGSRKENAQSRNINALFPYSSETYKTINSITRRGGIWCKCGGTSQNVVLNVYDQMLDDSSVIKTSNTAECKCYGSGPSDDNYAETKFENWTQEESNAAIRAWEAGTLIIKRFATIKSYSSSGHGTPEFRSGFYSDEISIAGSTVPFTQYGPVVAVFDVFRSDTGDIGDTDPESDNVYAQIRLGMNDSSGLTAETDPAPTLLIYFGSESDPSTESEPINVSEAFGLTAENLDVDKIIQIPGEWPHDTSYHFRLFFVVGYEVGASDVDIASRASIPLFVDENNNGVAIGQYSTATESEKKFECRWPAYLYGGIVQIGDGSQKVFEVMGIQAGSVAGQEVASGKTVDYDVAFDRPYKAAPHVVIGMMLGGDLADDYAAARLSCALISVSETGFKVRAYNYTGISEKPVIGFTWAAFGIT